MVMLLKAENVVQIYRMAVVYAALNPLVFALIQMVQTVETKQQTVRIKLI